MSMEKQRMPEGQNSDKGREDNAKLAVSKARRPQDVCKL